jgi:hypothetical protein
MNRFKVTGLSPASFVLIVALISGCAVGPYVAPPTPTYKIVGKNSRDSAYFY